MAGWQQELAGLLQELGVVPEEPQPHLRTRNRLAFPDVLDPSLYASLEAEETARYARDLGAMGREVDDIVRQVIRFTRRGDLEPAAREDILAVLHALHQLSVVSQEVEPDEEAFIESVSATLRFCRLILRLSETTIEGF